LPTSPSESTDEDTMLLSPQEANLFFKLHRTLLFYVNQRLHVLPETLNTPDEFGVQSPESRVKVHDALRENADLIGSFVNDNPAHFSQANSLSCSRGGISCMANFTFLEN
jgi:hypothetical protein